MEAFNDFPIKVVNGSPVYIRDIGHVRDGFAPQTNIVRQDGSRAVLLTVMKAGNASTLAVVDGVRKLLPVVAATLPPELKIQPLADQSIFVRASINGVIREAVIAACLTGLMILLFLGSWRSTLIIAVSIPLSILTSIIVLSFLHETINIMTLGGLALAVGILVDDATVEIENVNRNLDEGKEVERAILDGASQIAVPALVSTLCICIVFLPMFFLSGVARYLFRAAGGSRGLRDAGLLRPLADAGPHPGEVPVEAAAPRAQPQSPGAAPEGLRTRFRAHPRRLPGRPCGAGPPPHFVRAALPPCLPFRLSALPLARPGFLSRRRTPASSSCICAPKPEPVSKKPRASATWWSNPSAAQIPRDQLLNVLDEIGLPYSSINTIYSNSAPVGSADADIMVSLTTDHRPTEEYVRVLRAALPREFPGTEFYFLPDDIVSQILNFGLPAPIDVQIVGKNVEANRDLADRIMDQMRRIPGIADLRIQQTFDQPKLHIFTDRTKAAESGYTQNDVAQSLLISLSGSFQTQPTFWLSPQNGVSYSVVTQAPQYDVQSLQALRNLPLTVGQRGRAGNSQRRYFHQPRQRNGGGEPLRYSAHHRYFRRGGRPRFGQRRREVDRIVDANRQRLVRGSEMLVRGQVETMRKSFSGLDRGPDIRDCAGVSADRGEFSILARSVHHHYGAARGAGRNRPDALHHPHHAQRARDDGRHHVHGRGYREQHSGDQLRQGDAGGIP